jgi:hypothetical protein
MEFPSCTAIILRISLICIVATWREKNLFRIFDIVVLRLSVCVGHPVEPKQALLTRDMWRSIKSNKKLKKVEKRKREGKKKDTRNSAISHDIFHSMAFVTGLGLLILCCHFQ